MLVHFHSFHVDWPLAFQTEPKISQNYEVAVFFV